MIPERCLEYLVLRDFLNDGVSSEQLTITHHDTCSGWLTNGKCVTVAINDLKERISKLELDLLKDYITERM